MCRSRRFLTCTASVLLAFAAVATNGHLPAAETSPEAAQLDVFAPPTGDAYFALTLPGGALKAAPRPVDVVVIFDTSASQTGLYRDKALAALRSLSEGLAANDRVALLAADLDANWLSPQFHAREGAEMSAAMAALGQRVPLATTDMPKALDAALARIKESAAAGRDAAIVYIGDGQSPTNPLTGDALAAAANQLADAHVTVHSYVIGPRTDAPMLAALANQTGGVLAVDKEDMTGEQAGVFLAKSAAVPVFWSAEAALSESVSEVYPRRVPPVRADRETVLLGVATSPAISQVSIKGELDGKPAELQWKVAEARSGDDNGYLARLVDVARKDEGRTLPTVGAAGLAETRRIFQDNAQGLVQLSERALGIGDAAGAEKLANEALGVDPGNVDAQTVRHAAAKAIESGDEGSGVLRLTNLEQAEGAAAAPEPDVFDEPEVSILDEVEDQRRVLTGALQTEVFTTINDARADMGTNPEGAINILKLLMEKVRRATEVDPEIRAQLIEQIETSLQVAVRVAAEQEQLALERQALEARVDEQKRLTDDLALSIKKVDQLMDQMHALVLQGRYSEAEEVVEAAQAIRPQYLLSGVMDPKLAYAELWPRFREGYRQNLVLRDLRQRGVVDTLYSVELSHIPFSDREPIVYPPDSFWEGRERLYDSWQGMTVRRAKWKDQISLYEPGSAEERIYQALNKTVDDLPLDAETPLADVVLVLESTFGIDIEFDTRALSDAAIDQSAPLPTDRSFRGISLRSVLKLLLNDFDLTYVVDDEVLKITTQDVADTILQTRVYPVADLVIPIRSGGFGGGFGGGGGGFGGGGGGFGGGGGGFGGGGGGFGGGGGGFGGQGGGGGFFNVATEADAGEKPAAPQLKLEPSKKGEVTTAARAVAAKTPAAGAKTEPATASHIKPIRPAADADPTKFWNEYLTTNEVTGEIVRATVQELIERRQFDHVVGLIEAALRNRQGQPWMYEMLGLALEAQGRPLAERERALMSAVDFVDSVDHLIYLARYMATAGLDKRALALFRQAAEMEPTRTEPFVMGMRLAKKLGDIDGIRWSTAGVLGQAWPEKDAEIWHEAYRIAAATLEQLRTDNRKEEADKFEAELDQSVVRDCGIVVTWAGEADIDIVVEEPTGTVCSSRNNRTTSGGVMLGDVAPRVDLRTSQSLSESYVCPRGFNGTYRVLIRRVWGELPTDKVTVDVYLNYRSKNEVRMRQQIPVGDEDALVTFEVKDGRRVEALEAHQIANTVKAQQAVGREILAQQLNAAAQNNPEALGALLAARGTQNPSTGGNGGGGVPFPVFPGLQGAVGYQPVIVTLPTGANMGVTAVVSHDRRYVRISPTPIFSGISQVQTFNFVSGMSGMSPVPPGGGGFGGGGAGGGGFGGF